MIWYYFFFLGFGLGSVFVHIDIPLYYIQCFEFHMTRVNVVLLDPKSNI